MYPVFLELTYTKLLSFPHWTPCPKPSKKGNFRDQSLTVPAVFIIMHTRDGEHYQIRSMDSSSSLNLPLYWHKVWHSRTSPEYWKKSVTHIVTWGPLLKWPGNNIWSATDLSPLSKHLAFHYASEWSIFVCPPPSHTLTSPSVHLTVAVKKGTVINFNILHSIFCNDNTAFLIITHLNKSTKTTCNWFYSIYIVYIIVEEHTNTEISFVHTHLSLKHSKPTSRAAVYVGYTCV
jgi:hypothetical protein